MGSPYCPGRACHFLDGVKLPVVLRPLSKNAHESQEEVTRPSTTAIPASHKKLDDGSGTRYQLMGTCYLDGIMHVELMKGAPSEGSYLESFQVFELAEAFGLLWGASGCFGDPLSLEGL